MLKKLINNKKEKKEIIDNIYIYTHIEANIFQIHKPVLHNYKFFPVTLYWKGLTCQLIKAKGNTDKTEIQKSTH